MRKVALSMCATIHVDIPFSAPESPSVFGGRGGGLLGGAFEQRESEGEKVESSYIAARCVGNLREREKGEALAKAFGWQASLDHK